MAFDWKEYLDLARFLQGQGGINYSQEAALRSAVSRAYYAAFCHARNHENNHKRFMPTGKSVDHRLLRDHFQNMGRINIARDLDRLRGWRNMCDYHDSIPNISMLLPFAINQAQDIINGLP
ncbi:MAG TPA: hypothetical protein VI387_02665 [Candidatus Brocadiales bacterium]|nr:hypothetical protein [Candidatus Brocadiales bacterium]